MPQRGIASKITWVGLMALAAGVVGACSADQPIARTCPQILIPIDGSKMTRFRPGAGRDITDIVHEESIAGFSHGCTYDIDETGAGDLRIELVPDIESARGPANQTGSTEFEYFVAIVSPDKAVLEKKRFPVSVQYPANMSRIAWRRDEPISMKIPLKAGEMGENYTIYIGLQMTREEVDYQRTVR